MGNGFVGTVLSSSAQTGYKAQSTSAINAPVWLIATSIVVYLASVLPATIYSNRRDVYPTWTVLAFPGLGWGFCCSPAHYNEFCHQWNCPTRDSNQKIAPMEFTAGPVCVLCRGQVRIKSRRFTQLLCLCTGLNCTQIWKWSWNKFRLSWETVAQCILDHEARLQDIWQGNIWTNKRSERLALDLPVKFLFQNILRIHFKKSFKPTFHEIKSTLALTFQTNVVYTYITFNV